MLALYTAASGMAAMEKNVEVISNNIANTKTTGYKRQSAQFQDLLYEINTRAGSSTSSSGTLLPAGIEIGTGVRMVSTVRTMSQGTITSSDRNLDLAISGKGFFRIQRPDGTIGFTRDGSFTTDAQGQLVTSKGYVVDPGITIPSNATSISISSAGLVQVKLPAQAAPQDVGKIQLSHFANETGLEATGDNLFAQTAASGDPVTADPGTDGLGDLQQGYLEEANVNAVSEISSLITAQRSYEMNSRANRVVEAAQKLGVKQIIGDTTGSITITRQGRRIASSEVDASLTQAIIAKGEIDQPDYTFINGASVPDLYVEEGLAGAPVITDLKIDRETLRFSASVTVPGSASLAKMPLKLEGQITEMVDVPMAAHALGKNDIITAFDIRIEKRDRKAIAGIIPVRPSTLKGQAARTSIATGSIITEDLVMKPILVEKAMAVSVTYATGGLHLTLRGKANESGALGDMISVLNPQSKKSLFATVTGPGTVAILSDVPAPIASRQAANTVQ